MKPGRVPKYTDEEIAKLVGWDDFRKHKVLKKTGLSMGSVERWLERMIIRGEVIKIKWGLYRTTSNSLHNI